jgi:Mg2+ and Co2+ transporter CorA
MLYEIIQAMLEKMFRVSANVGKDIKTIENKVFDETSSSLVKDIMIKKRNIVVLKHMFKPQISVLKMLEDRVNQLFK